MITFSEEAKNKISKITPDNFFVVTDFDRTLTTHDGINTWSLIPKMGIFDKSYSEKSIKAFKHYYPIEMDYTLSEEYRKKKIIEWWYLELDLFIEYKVTLTHLKQAASLDNVFSLRDGVKEFIEFCNQKSAPFIILSAGIGDIIELYLQKNGLNLSNVKLISNFMETKNDLITGFKSAIVFSQNKNESAHLYLKSVNDKTHKNILLFGDKIEDVLMVPKENHKNTLLIGFYDEKKDDIQKYQTGLNLFKQAYDVVCTDNTSFSELLKALNFREIGRASCRERV